MLAEKGALAVSGMTAAGLIANAIGAEAIGDGAQMRRMVFLRGCSSHQRSSYDLTTRIVPFLDLGLLKTQLPRDERAAGPT